MSELINGDLLYTQSTIDDKNAEISLLRRTLDTFIIDANNHAAAVLDCHEYLKDGETPAQCIQRNRDDVVLALGQLAKVAQEKERLSLDYETAREAHDAARSEAREYETENVRLRAEVQHLTHQVISCGIAARHPELYCKDGSPYGGKWSSKQSGEIYDHCTVLRDKMSILTSERDQYRADWMALSQKLRIREAQLQSIIDAKHCGRCGGMLPQHMDGCPAQCAEAKLAKVTAERDAIKNTLELREHFINECEVALGIQNADCTVTILTEIKRLSAYDAALEGVRGEMPEEVDRLRLAVKQHPPSQWHTDRLLTLLAYIDFLQLAEAANRNAIAVAQVTIAAKYARISEYAKDWDQADKAAVSANKALADSQARARELQQLCSTARDTLGYLQDMHHLSPSDSAHVTELRAALASSLTGDNQSLANAYAVCKGES